MTERRGRFSLPREGFHADTLGSIVRATLFNPALLLPTVLLARFTERGRLVAADRPKLFSWARIFATLGVIRVINGWFNRRALNHAAKDVYDWDNEVVVVTGGSDGIGKRIVQMLAQRNVKVIVLDVQPLTYEKTSTIYYFPCDITSTTSLQTVAQEIRSSIGNPTILINNAGVCRGKTILSNTDDDLSLTFNVNAIAHYKLAREFVPYMTEKNHGMVVTIASMAAAICAPRMTDYAASKSAAVAFHEGLAAELVAEHNAPRVRTVLVQQGHTETKLFEGFKHGPRFFGPSLHVDTVAEAVVEQVLKGESGYLILPRLYRLLAVNIRSLPLWLQYNFRAGLSGLMADWKGRQVQ
ncbi:MAG: hypothetical protein M1831_000505 [Alyxoria varia]|nr:MAG: hypothetical protein M1831_000505 [Alyxoria varia]